MCCYRKADRPLSEKDIACIQLHLIVGYKIDHSDFPNSICSGCQLELLKKDNSNESSIKILVNDYKVCVIRLCEVVKMSGITYQRMMNKKHGIPKEKNAVAPPNSYKVCSNCLAIIYRGSNPTAITCKNSRRSKVYNMEALVQSSTTLHGVASCVIKDTACTPLANLGAKRK